MAENSEGTAKKQRGSGKPFAKGASGNPGGRPKVAEEFKERCRRVVDASVFAAWENEIISQGPDWMEASKLLAAYGYGKPAQAVELTGKDSAPLSISIVRTVKA
jgi:hypothetical protein